MIIRKSITGAQVFINRIPKIFLKEEIQSKLESEFGKIVKIHEGAPFESKQEEVFHLYVQF